MRKDKAFTLMELLTVIAVMAVLAGLLLPALNRARARARIAAAESMIASLQVALSMYNMDYGVYPASSNAAGSQYNGNSFATIFDGSPNNLVAALSAGTRGGPYMEFRGRDLIENSVSGAPAGRRFALADPWGRAYVYTARRVHGGGTVDPNAGPFYPDTDNPENNTYNIFSLGPNGLTHDGSGARGFENGTWHVSELVENEECGDWRSTNNPDDPGYDDINSWDGARR